MPTRLHPFDLGVVAVYLAGITLFGLQFSRRAKRAGAGDGATKSVRGYFLADGTIPWWAIALSIVSAETSTLTIISIPGVAFAGNFGFMQVVLGYLLGRVVVAGLFLPRYIRGEMLTAYQLIDRRFGHALHKVTAGLFLVLRAAAEGVRVFAISIVVGIAIGTNDVASIAIITALTLAYTFEGGMAAVIWTDVVQMGLYVAGTVVALVTLGAHVPGGWGHIHAVAAPLGKFRWLDFSWGLSTSYTFWAGLLGGTFLTMASHGTDQLMVQRMLAAKNLRESQTALLASGVVIFVQFALFLLIGVGLFVFYGGAGVGGLSPDRIFPTFIVGEMPVGVAGLLVAAILAAAMSNLSAALNSLSSATVVDFYMGWRPKAAERERMLVSRGATVAWGFVLFAIAVYSLGVGGKGHVVELGLSIASVAYGCLLGVFLLGTLTAYATQAGAIVGMVCGFAVNLTLWLESIHVLANPLVGVRVPAVAFTWYVLIGAVVTFCVGLGASVVLRPRVRVAVAAMVVGVVLIGRCVAQGPQLRSEMWGTLQNQGESRSFAALRMTILDRGGRGKSIRGESFAALRMTMLEDGGQAPGGRGANPTSQTRDVGHPVGAAYDFAGVSAAIEAAIAQKKLPGAVVVVGHGGKVVFEQAYGVRKLAGEPGIDGRPSAAEPMTVETVFDMASLTKCLVTATAVMQLVEQGKVDVDAPVAKYLPEFGVNGKDKVTVRELLTHYSGLPPDVDLKDAWGLAAPDKAEGLRRAMAAKLDSVPGTKFVYSDVNFITLGAIVEKVSGETLDAYAARHVFGPLGMAHTRYLAMEKGCGRVSWAAPPGGPVSQAIVGCGADGWRHEEWVPEIAPTAHDNEGTAATNPDFDHLLRGTVHDPTTRRMGGVAGHAGVFSDAHDVSLYAQALLDKLLRNAGPFPLTQATLTLMTTPAQPATALGGATVFAADGKAVTGVAARGFGWDINSAYSRPRGEVFATVGTGKTPSFGHTGFTGTSLWIDPASDSYVVLLANAIHPRGNPPISALRGQVATAAARALGLGGGGASTGIGGAPTQVSDARPGAPGGGGASAGVGGGMTQVSDARPGAPGSVAGVGMVGVGTPTLHDAGAMDGAPGAVAGPKVATGIDVLEATGFAALTEAAGRHGGLLRVGLLTNQTGVDARGRRTIDVLDGLRGVGGGVELVKLFSPEHGIFGAKDSMEIGREVDAASGLKVIGLYGAKEADRRPKAEELKDLDAVVIDLQDAGVRFYTYETVVGYFLEASACEEGRGHALQVIVLDRPAMIGGEAVQGPISDTAASYINYMPEPVRNGMTLGELGRYMRVEHPGTCGVGAELTVVPMKGWARGKFFDATGVTWVNPSPNLRSVEEAVLYPGLGMLDATNVSVGRGTAMPFEVFGAGVTAAAKDKPAVAAWFDGKAVAAYLTGRKIPGVAFAATRFVVAEDGNRYPYHGQTIEGVRLTVTDRAALDSPELGVEIVGALQRLYPGQFRLEAVTGLVANMQAMAGLARGDDPRTIAAGWASGLAAFKERRAEYLLYP